MYRFAQFFAGTAALLWVVQLLFDRVRERRRSAQEAHERAAGITRRLRELLAVPMPTKAETPSINACGENDSAYLDAGAALKRGVGNNLPVVIR